MTNGRRARTGLIAALDIGSSKITCFIAQVDAGGTIRVIGIGHHVSQGVRGGAVVDMDAAETAILAAVAAAEQHAGERIREVIVNLSSGRPSSHSVAFEVEVGGHEIGESDVGRVLSHARLSNGTGGQETIHAIPVGFAIDGNPHVRDPRGMFGETLGVDMHLISADPGALRNLERVIARCHLAVEAIVVSAYAAGLAALVEDEKDLGVTVVDMGAGTTQIAVFYEGEIVHVDGIPVGGAHVTSDIARGLSTPVADAERMKTLYGSALPSPSDERELIDVPLLGEERHVHANHVPRSMLVGIVRPRIEEIFELVRSRLEASGMGRIAGRRLVLTGGASQLPGAGELAGLVLEKQVRLGRPIRVLGLAEATSGPAFSVCAGLLRHAVENREHAHVEPALEDIAPLTRLGRLGHWFKENF